MEHVLLTTTLLDVLAAFPHFQWRALQERKVGFWTLATK
jgi:hypothetical protein